MDNLIIGQKLKVSFDEDNKVTSTGWFCGYASVCDYSDGSDEVGTFLNTIVKFETYGKVTWELIDPKWIEIDND